MLDTIPGPWDMQVINQSRPLTSGTYSPWGEMDGNQTHQESENVSPDRDKAVRCMVLSGLRCWGRAGSDLV